MSCGCRKNNNCGCQRPEPRNCGCGCNGTKPMNDFTDIFECGERDLGPYTWNGYVWYDVEVTYSGPYYAGARRPEPRNGGCGQRNNGCGCGCNR